MGIINLIINAWLNRHTLEGLYETFGSMLDDAQWMFGYVHEAMIGREKSPSEREKFYMTDQSINRREQDIRGKILNHLVLNPCDAITECLTFMSVVKDAERLGDYCKNILEVVEHPSFRKHFHGGPDPVYRCILRSRRSATTCSAPSWKWRTSSRGPRCSAL
jgi:phosphate uptake regulator